MIRFDYKTLKAIQAGREITNLDLAKRASVCLPTLSGARAGRLVNLRLLARIADVLGCDVEVRFIPRADADPIFHRQHDTTEQAPALTS